MIIIIAECKIVSFSIKTFKTTVLWGEVCGRHPQKEGHLILPSHWHRHWLCQVTRKIKFADWYNLAVVNK